MSQQLIEDSLIALRPSEVARLLNVRVETLSRWRASNRGPAFRADQRTIRYSKAAVIEWLKGQSSEGR